MKVLSICLAVILMITTTCSAVLAESSGIDYMALVNKQNPLPEGWEDALETVHVTNSVGDDVEVEVKAYEAYLALAAELEAEGIHVELDSARRSVAAQQDIWDRFMEKYGEEYTRSTVATPGYSEHHTGLALDLYFQIDGQDVYYNEDMTKDEYLWVWEAVHAKLADHGFILRYLKGKEDITGYSYEPWHIRYLDDSVTAHEIMDNGLTLEEYLELDQDDYDYESEPMPEAAAAFEGAWQCGRATLEMYWEELGFKVLIRWGGSAWDVAEWEYSCFYNEENNTIESMPFGLRTDLVYGDNGEVVSSTEIYDDGEATFALTEDGFLTWDDMKENAGEGMLFEKLPVYDSMFLTIGAAMEEAEYNNIGGDMDDYYIIVVNKDGTNLRVVAQLDDIAREMNKNLFNADDIEYAIAEYEEYVKTLPVLYTEEITAVPMDQAELDTYIGKTIGFAEEEGFEVNSYGGDEAIGVEFTMTNGLYSYDFAINEPFEAYLALSEDGGDYSEFTIKSVRLVGISYNVLNLDYEADGTYIGSEEDGDIFDGAFDFMQILYSAAESGAIDMDTLFDSLIEAMPDQADEIRSAMEQYGDLFGNYLNNMGEGVQN